MLHSRRLNVILERCLELLQLLYGFRVEVISLSAGLAGDRLYWLEIWAVSWRDLLILCSEAHALLLHLGRLHGTGHVALFRDAVARAVLSTPSCRTGLALDVLSCADKTT